MNNTDISVASRRRKNWYKAGLVLGLANRFFFDPVPLLHMYVPALVKYGNLDRLMMDDEIPEKKLRLYMSNAKDYGMYALGVVTSYPDKILLAGIHNAPAIRQGIENLVN